MTRTTDIVEILREIVENVAPGLTITTTDSRGRKTDKECPRVNYVFGSGKYIKGRLDELSRSKDGTASKLPMIALFTPVMEERNSPDYHAKMKVNIIIACRTSREWSNEQRLVYSFRNVLRPIYGRFLELLRADRRLDFGYDGCIRHQYIENYSYGKYGALTATGEAVSEPIDAIDIRNLELKINNLNCR